MGHKYKVVLLAPDGRAKLTYAPRQYETITDVFNDSIFVSMVRHGFTIIEVKQVRVILKRRKGGYATYGKTNQAGSYHPVTGTNR